MSLKQVEITRLTPSNTHIQAARRARFKDEDIAELAASIKKVGMLQPIVVREVGDDYEIIAGERRYLAAKQAGLKDVAVNVVELNDEETLEAQLIENLQRKDLHPLEEAAGYAELRALKHLDGDKKVAETIAASIGKSRTHVFDILKLNDLTDEAKALFNAGKFEKAVALEIARLPAKYQLEAAEVIAEDEMTVRDAKDFIERKFKSNVDGDKTIEKAIKDGHTVYDGKDAEQFWKNGWDKHPVAHLAVDVELHYRDGGGYVFQSMRQALPKSAFEKSVFIRHPKGAVVEALSLRDAADVHIAHKIALPEPLERFAPEDSKQAIEKQNAQDSEAKAKQQREFETRVHHQTFARIKEILRGKYPAKIALPELRILASGIVEDVIFDLDDTVDHLLGKSLGGEYQDSQVLKKIAGATERELTAFIFDAFLEHSIEFFDALCKKYAVNEAVIRKQVIADLKGEPSASEKPKTAPKKPAAKKAPAKKPPAKKK